MSPQVDEREMRPCSHKRSHACHGYVLESIEYWCEGVPGYRIVHSGAGNCDCWACGEDR